jgi:hypothetical protein
VFPQVEKAAVNPKPTYLEPHSLSYAFKPLAVTFNSPAEITFRYPPSTAAPHQCAVFYRDEGSYWRCLSSRNDPEHGTITAQVPFFATFALMRDAYPPVITHLFPQSGTSVRAHHTTYSARLSDKGTGIDYLKTYRRQ